MQFLSVAEKLSVNRSYSDCLIHSQTLYFAQMATSQSNRHREAGETPALPPQR